MPVLAAALLASSCGGGGGGGGASSPGPRVASSPPPPPPQNCIQTAPHGCLSPEDYERRRQTIEDGHGRAADFANQWGLAAIRADRAYAQLALQRGTAVEPGAGQTVGLIDSGIDIFHPVFAGKTVTETFLPGASDETGERRSSHGTAVASVIAARPSDTFTAQVDAARGVARGADIAMFAIPLGEGHPRYIPTTLPELAAADDRWHSWIETATGWSRGGRRLDFVNMSVGINGIVDQYSESGLRANFADTIAALAQDGVSDKTVFVWAAGNANGLPCLLSEFPDDMELCKNLKVVAVSAEILAGLPARIEELREVVIAVVAVAPDYDGDGEYEIADFSNRCGIAAAWCIAAPGEDVRLAYFGPYRGEPSVRGAYTSEGTSFAAPMVTGGLALMKTLFRGQLSNTALVARLYATANKTGIYADSDIYGQGLLDLGAATAPAGAVTVALGARVDGPGGPLAGTRFAAGGAFGDGLARAFAGREIAAFDALGAPFWLPLATLAGAPPRASAAARLRGFAAPAQPTTAPLAPRFAALTAGAAGPALGVMRPGAGHLSLAGGALALTTETGGGLGIAAFSTEGLPGRAPASGARVSWQPDGTALGLTGGFVSERKTVLGGAAGGAFGRLAGGAAFAGIRADGRIGPWRVAAGAEIGGVRAAAQGGMIAAVSPLATSAFALRAERRLAGGRLALALAQPLRIEAGRARLSVPEGRSKDGRVLRRTLTAGLEPSGREIGVTLEWRRPLTPGGELGLGAGWTRQPGHDAAADPDLGLLAAWRLAF